MTGQVEENSDLEEYTMTEQVSPGQDHTLPILLKVEVLKSKVKNLSSEHAQLSNQVKGFAAEPFLGPEIFGPLIDLSNRNELMKKKYVEECELMKKKHAEECELLKKKYLEESLERKRLYNEVIELKGNIRVFCRCRPINQNEIKNGFTSVVDHESSGENDLHIICSDSSRKQFKFDHVFRPEADQEAVFAETSPIVTSVLDGFNVCIFAYGQTGTGKTFTMEGIPENRGVNYRTLENLFRISNERSDVMRYELYVSMLEVYNEKIRDLLEENSNQPSKRLEIKQSSNGTQEVPGLVEANVHSTDEIWELLKTGNRARSVGSTNANELSSRSHCLLRLTVKGENLLSHQQTKSHLWLVDLAGSERVGKIEVEGERLKESQFINKSLSALGDVISALASKSPHVPYRNSKLTHMLQSSLGGDCKTLMFVQMSPSSSDLGETLCSLNFASRVRGIEQGPARKQTDIFELNKYKQLVEKVKHDEKELKKLQDSVQSLQFRLNIREQASKNFQNKAQDLENLLAEERKTRLKQESRGFAASKAERKPPLAPPSKKRPPLGRLTNIFPSQPGLSSSAKPYSMVGHHPISSLSSSLDKENNNTTAIFTSRTIQARRGSFVPAKTNDNHPSRIIQPRRRTESLSGLNPTITPLKGFPSVSGVRTGGQFVWRRTSMVPSSSSSSFSMVQKVKEETSLAVQRSCSSKFRGSPSPLAKYHNPVVAAMRKSIVPSSSSSMLQKVKEETPLTSQRSCSSKFRGSPHQANPVVVALQKKRVIWSPLKMKAKGKGRRISYFN